MRPTVLLSILLATSLACADERPDEILRLENRAASVDEAVGKLEETKQEARKEYAETREEVGSQLDSARSDYHETVAEAEKRAISDLKHLAKQAAADGDIAEASDRWEAVLRIDRGDEEAQEFFKTIGRYDVIAKRIKRAKGDRAGANEIPHPSSDANTTELDSLVGVWQFRWGTTGGFAKRKFTRDNITVVDGRYIVDDPDKKEIIELIPQDGRRMLILAWSRGEDRSPYTSFFSIKGQPNHVGIAWRDD